MIDILIRRCKDSLLINGVLLLAAMQPPLFAQVAGLVRANSVEVGPFVGLSYGLDATRILAGGNVTYGINRYILPYFEYSYFPGFVRRETVIVNDPSGPVPFRANTRIPFQDIHGGVHIRFPIRESPIVPYAVFGTGAVVYKARTVTFAPASANTSAAVPPPLRLGASSDFALNFGGGIRYYVSQRWGMRLEGKAYKATGRFTDTFGKFEVGLFYQFR